MWNFGDGSTLSTGGNTNVSHTYANMGSYTVSLTAYGPGGDERGDQHGLHRGDVGGAGGRVQRDADEPVCDADGDVHGRLDGEHHQLGVELWGWA